MMMEEAAGAVGAAWSAARGWLTPAVLFVAINLVIATIAVASRLTTSSSPPAEPAGGGRDDDDNEAAGERHRGVLQRAPSFLAFDRLLRSSSLSISRLGLAPDHTPVPVQPLSGDDEPEPSLQQKRPAPEASQHQQLETAEHQRAEARVERSRSEAAAPVEAPNNRRRRAAAADEELDGHGGGEEAAAAVEVDARADDFIRRFREQLRLQRLDSILRYRDSLRRTGTA